MKKRELKKVLKKAILGLVGFTMVGIILTCVAFMIYYKLTLHMDLLEAFGGFCCLVPLLIAPAFLGIEVGKCYFNYKIKPYRTKRTTNALRKVA